MKLQNNTKYNHMLALAGKTSLFFSQVIIVYLLILQYATCSLASQNINYKVEFQGSHDKKIGVLLQNVSGCLKKEDQPLTSSLLLRKRAMQDLEIFQKAMQSRGYFAGKVSFSIDSSKPILLLTFTVNTGPLYILNKITIKPQLETNGFHFTGPGELGLKKGAPAISRTILDAGIQLPIIAKEQGYAFAELMESKIVVDHLTRSMDAAFTIRPGPKVSLGQISLQGLQNINPAFFLARIPWQYGIIYSPNLLEKTRQAMVKTGLLSTARINLVKEPDENGAYPVIIDLKPRKQRTISYGAGYSTDIGFSINSGWEHRNYYGSGEYLNLEGELSLVSTMLGYSYRKPDFKYRDWNLISRIRFKHDETEAYDRDSLETGIGVDGPLAPSTTGGVGLDYRLVEILDFGDEEETEGKEVFGLISLPLKITTNKRNDLLDPAWGWLFSIHAAPYLDTLGSGIAFAKFRSQYNHYFTLFDAPRLVLAGRVAVGVLVGADRDEVPADERYYSGGGGSIRGYSFQMAGPLDSEDEPLGGSSFLEASAELRYRIRTNIGLVAFWDKGNTFESSSLRGDDLLDGAGAGLRYVTPVGPLRLDFGFPLNRRNGVDSSFQVYISIGQAF